MVGRTDPAALHRTAQGPPGGTVKGLAGLGETARGPIVPRLEIVNLGVGKPRQPERLILTHNRGQSGCELEVLAEDEQDQSDYN